MMTRTCTSCDALVDFTAQRLEPAPGGRYRHVDYEDCQAALRWWEPAAHFTWAQGKNDDVRRAQAAPALEVGDD